MFCQNLCKSIQKKARADLAPPQICHFSATKLSVQPSRKSNPAVGTNPVQHDCSQRNDKFVAELNRLKLSSELTCTGFGKAKVGAVIPLCPKKYASMGLKCRMKAPGASEEKLSALEAFVPPTHFVEWVGEPD